MIALNCHNFALRLAVPPAGRVSTQRPAGGAANRAGFTLTELLIVISIIVLFVTIALPAFNLMSGSKSISGAENQVGAFLGRARAEAIGLQTVRGVGFYVDAASGRSAMAIVQQAANNAASYSNTVVYPAGSYVSYNSKYYVAATDVPAGTVPAAAPWSQVDANAIDVSTDSDAVLFPPGIGLQLLNNGSFLVGSGSIASNNYISYGAVLFDGFGRLVSKHISIPKDGSVGTRSNLNTVSVGKNLPPIGSTVTVDSSLGFVLYDQAALANQGTAPPPLQGILTAADSTGINAGSFSTQDNWLKNNATPLLVNRYNGTLVKGE